MPISNKGFEGRRISEVLTALNQDQKTNLSPDVDTAPDTVLGVINSILAGYIAEQELLTQAVSDNLNVDKAEGKALGDLVASTGLVRLGTSPSTGFLSVTAKEGTILQGGTEFLDESNNLVSIDETSLVTSELATTVILSIEESDPEGTSYVISVNNDQLTKTKGAGETGADVLDAIATALGTTTATVTYDANPLELTIRGVTETSTVRVVAKENLKIQSVTALLAASSVSTGPVSIEAGSVDSIVSAVSGFLSVTNVRAFSKGREIESDEQLRRRLERSFGLAGSGTFPAILAKVSQVDGVSSVAILENDSSEPDQVNGIPANSYECIVVGGDDINIAQTIFNSKPLSAETFGNTDVSIRFGDQTKVINFSRPTPLYLWVHVEYDLYSEEEFPEDGEQGILDAISDHFNSLNVGEDIIPRRAFGKVYSAVPGIKTLIIKVTTTDSPTETPTGFSENVIAVPTRNYASLKQERIELFFGDIIVGN